MTGALMLPHDWFPMPLPANVELGDGTWLYSSYAFIHCRSRMPSAVRVGKSSGIYNGSFFELGTRGQVSIGDYCTLVGATISTNSMIRIGSYCFIAHEVVIADSVFAVPPDPSSIDNNAFQLCVEIEDDVWIGAGAIILSGARIGAGAIVGAGAVVNSVVPAGSIFGGNPGRVLGTVRADRSALATDAIHDGRR